VNSRNQILTIFFAGLTTALVFQNCSDVAFKDASVSSSAVHIQCVLPSTPALEPVEKYRWDYSNSTNPDYHNVMSTPAVGDIDGDKIPEIVFSSYASDYNGAGILRVISGSSGKEISSLNQETLAPKGDSAVLLVDIDKDGKS